MRPDLAVGAMKHILQRTEEDERRSAAASSRSRTGGRSASPTSAAGTSRAQRHRRASARRAATTASANFSGSAPPRQPPCLTAVPAPALAAATAAAAASPPLSALEGLSVGQTVSDLKRGLRAARREGVHGLHVPRHTLLRPPDAVVRPSATPSPPTPTRRRRSPSRSAPVLGWAGAQPLSGHGVSRRRARRATSTSARRHHSPGSAVSAAGSPTPLRGRARSIVRDFTPDMTIDADAAPPSPSTLRARRARALDRAGSPTMR